MAIKQFPSLIQTAMATSELTMSNLINNKLVKLPKDTPPKTWKNFVSENLHMAHHPVHVDSRGRVHVYDDLDTFKTDMAAESPRVYGSLISMKTAQDVIVDEIGKWAEEQDFSGGGGAGTGGGGGVTGVDADGVLREVRVDTEVRVDIREQLTTVYVDKETITEVKETLQPISEIKNFFVYTPNPPEQMFFYQPGYTPGSDGAATSTQVNQRDAGTIKKALLEIRFNSAVSSSFGDDFSAGSYQVICSNASNRFDANSNAAKKANVRLKNKRSNGFDLISNTIDGIVAAEAVYPIDLMVVLKGSILGHATVYMNLQPGQGY